MAKKKPEALSRLRDAIDEIESNVRMAENALDEVEAGRVVDLEMNNLDEAFARAQRGQIDDALVHLGRALPASHADLADILARHFRSRP